MDNRLNRDQQHDITLSSWWDALTGSERETLLRVLGVSIVQPSSLEWDELSPGTHERIKSAFRVGPHGRVDFAENSYEALRDADALAVLTDWNEYRHPDFERMRSLLRRPLVVDGRNLYAPEKMQRFGFEYHSIGRGRDATAGGGPGAGGVERSASTQPAIGLRV